MDLSHNSITSANDRRSLSNTRSCQTLRYRSTRKGVVAAVTRWRPRILRWQPQSLERGDGQRVNPRSRGQNSRPIPGDGRSSWWAGLPKLPGYGTAGGRATPTWAVRGSQGCPYPLSRDPVPPAASVVQRSISGRSHRRIRPSPIATTRSGISGP